MCLMGVTRQFRRLTQKIHRGYKVVIVPRSKEGVYRPYWTTYYNRRQRFSVWLAHKNASDIFPAGVTGTGREPDMISNHIRASDGENYPVGFHVFATKQAAEIYKTTVINHGDPALNPFFVLPVEYRGRLVEGYEAARTNGTNFRLKVIVAKELRIPMPAWVDNSIVALINSL